MATVYEFKSFTDEILFHRVSNGPIQFISALKIWHLLAKITRGCSLARAFRIF